MNRRQIVALWLGVAAGISVLLYPPWVAQIPTPGGSLSGPRQWTWLWSRPFGPALAHDLDPHAEAEQIWEQVKREVQAAGANYETEWLVRRTAAIKQERAEERERERKAGVFEHYRIDIQVLGVEMLTLSLFFGALIASLAGTSRRTLE